MTFGERLRHLREERGLRQEDVAEAFFVVKSTVSQWETSIHAPRDQATLVKLADYFNSTVDYLLGRSAEPHPLAGSFPLGETRRIPIYAEGSAGLPKFVPEDIVGYEYISAEDVRGGEYFFLRVTGDSMIGKRIQEGDLLLVRKQPVLEDGQIGVFVTEDGVTIKTFHKQGNLAILTPENPAHKPQCILLRDLTIVGEVIEAKIKFNGR